MEIGEMEWQKVKVISIMPMVMYTKENSTKIELMDLVCMCIKMDKLMKVFGKMICKMVLERKNSKMDQSTMDSGNAIKQMAMVPLFMQMVISMRVNG